MSKKIETTVVMEFAERFLTLCICAWEENHPGSRLRTAVEDVMKMKNGARMGGLNYGPNDPLTR